MKTPFVLATAFLLISGLHLLAVDRVLLTLGEAVLISQQIGEDSRMENVIVLRGQEDRRSLAWAREVRFEADPHGDLILVQEDVQTYSANENPSEHPKVLTADRIRTKIQPAAQKNVVIESQGQRFGVTFESIIIENDQLFLRSVIVRNLEPYFTPDRAPQQVTLDSLAFSLSALDEVTNRLSP